MSGRQPIYRGAEGVFSFVPKFDPSKLRVRTFDGVDPDVVCPDLVFQRGRRVVVKIRNDGPGGMFVVTLLTYQWGDPIGRVARLLESR